jgi:hypothetical protein
MKTFDSFGHSVILDSAWITWLMDFRHFPLLGLFNNSVSYCGTKVLTSLAKCIAFCSFKRKLFENLSFSNNSINVGNINWTTKCGFGWGFHAFNIEGSKDWHQSLILPIEINYSPFKNDNKYLWLLPSISTMHRTT